MKKRTRAYWKKRFREIEEAEHRKGAETYANIEEQFRKAEAAIERKIEMWYARFAENNEISYAEAKRWLNKKELAELKWDVNEYIKHGEENALSGEWTKELVNASSRAHISRLEALKLQLQQEAEVLYGNELDEIDTMARDVYKDTFYRSAFAIQQGFEIGWDLASIDPRLISKVINKPWAADGKDFSERIWGNRKQLVENMNTIITQNIIRGEDPQKAIDAIAKKMNTSKQNAGRLVMTEEAAFSSAARQDCFKDLGVKQFEIVATLDSHTSELCRDMDGKVFKMSDYEVGVTAPPFHVYCRSTTVPYFEDDFGEAGERAARDEATGKTYYVPADMTYREWQKKFVNGGDKPGLKETGNGGAMKEHKSTDSTLNDATKSDNITSTRRDRNSMDYRHLVEAQEISYRMDDEVISTSRKLDGSLCDIRVSDTCSLKPKRIHEIELMIRDALDRLSDRPENLPTFILLSDTELPERTRGRFIGERNALFFKPTLDKDADRWCLQHELFHWVDYQTATDLGFSFQDDDNFVSYMCIEAKARLDEAKIDQYNAGEISGYAYDRYLQGRFDEVYVEYRVKKLLRK